MAIREPSLKSEEQRSELARKVVELIRAFNAREDAADLSGLEDDIAALQAADVALDSRVDDLETAPAAASPVTLRGFRSEDQGGAYSQGVTRVHWAGLSSYSSSAIWYGTGNTGSLQSIAGGMAYAIPDHFERAALINRLVTRTNGGVHDAASRFRLGVYAEGSLSSGVLTGSPYPGALLAQSGNLAPASNNATLETVSSLASIAAGTRVFFVWVCNTAAVTANYTMPAYRIGNLFPFLGFVWNTGTPTTLSTDEATAGVGWRHSITYTGSEDLPDPFPQSAPAILTGGAGSSAIPAVGFGRQIT
jgi:hypothetical protein